MAKNLSEVIDEIMPFVEERDKDTSFIIMRNKGDAYLPWFVEYSYSEDTAKDALRECRESDPYAVKFKGADFNGGNFAFVYDEVLCARLRAEYDAEPFGTLHVGEFRALINAVEDNIGSFSQNTIDYILEYDKPLHALYDLNTVSLYDRDNPDGEPYERDKVDEFVEEIKYLLDETQSRSKDTRQSEIGADFSDAKVNKHDTPHVISSLLINGVDIELGEATGLEQPFYVESNRGGAVLFSMRTENYPEAVKAYAEQITEQVQAMGLDRDNAAFVRGASSAKLTADRCVPDSKNADYTGQLVILDAASLKPEYRNIFSQLVLCTHGNGARPNAIGRSVFGRELYSGEFVGYDRGQILGIADESLLPKWVEAKMEMRRDASVFEFGGYHFKPYRQFRKGEVDKHLAGDSRPEKKDAQYAMRNMSSDFSLAISSYDWGKADYSYEKFCAAAKSAESAADIFSCLENGRLYVPGENELFRYKEPPLKEKTVPAEKPDMLAKISNNKQKVERDKAAAADAPANRRKKDKEV